MSRRNQLVIPLNLEKIVEVSSSVRTLDEICESLDYTKLYNAYRRRPAKNKADPVSLFKVLVYGNMTGCYSARSIEEACKTNINFMWLLNEAEAPSRSTIDRFRRGRIKEALDDLFSERSDQLTLIPFLEDTEKKTGIRYKEIVADAGYESEENYVYLNEHNQESYIKPSNYEASKKRKKKPYCTESFIYNAETDTFTCPEKQELKPLYIKNSKTKSGYISEKTVYGATACENCPNKHLCTKSDKGRTLQRAKVFADFRNKSFRNITTPKGIELRTNRSIQVEGAFGVLYGFRRFLTRGKENVEVEMLLLCFAFNINKLHNKTAKNRRRTHLFEKLTA